MVRTFADRDRGRCFSPRPSAGEHCCHGPGADRNCERLRMTDPRKPVLPTDRSDSPESMSAYDLTYSILRRATEIGARSLRCTGASFVPSAMGIWALELRDIDRRAGAEFLRALADMVEIDDAPGSDATA